IAGPKNNTREPSYASSISRRSSRDAGSPSRRRSTPLSPTTRPRGHRPAARWNMGRSPRHRWRRWYSDGRTTTSHRGGHHGMSGPQRRKSAVVNVGGVAVGGRRPIVVQSMTNTDTADVDATVAQVRALHAAGSELVRVTVNTEAAARAVPEIVRQVEVPVIGDFHYNGHVLLTKYPDCARALAKYRINPGNVGGKHHDENFRAIVQVAIDNGKPVRIGVNWGSLDQMLLTEMMDANARAAAPLDARDVTMNAIVESAIRSAELAEQTGLGHDR